jgi:hypothetical protein
LLTLLASKITPNESGASSVEGRSADYQQRTLFNYQGSSFDFGEIGFLFGERPNIDNARPRVPSKNHEFCCCGAIGISIAVRNFHGTFWGTVQRETTAEPLKIKRDQEEIESRSTDRKSVALICRLQAVEN